MSIRNCRIIAIEGSHGTGKSTLVHALTAHYKSSNIHAASLAELARESPFVEETVIHKYAEFDLSAELHLFASQIAREQLLARFHQLLICDKTIANVLGYSRIFLPNDSSAFQIEMLAHLQTFCRIYATQYDAVIFVSDVYDLLSTQDPFRPKDIEFQRQADESIKNVCREMNIPLMELPLGLSLAEKVAWVVEHTQSLNSIE